MRIRIVTKVLGMVLGISMLALAGCAVDVNTGMEGMSGEVVQKTTELTISPTVLHEELTPTEPPQMDEPVVNPPSTSTDGGGGHPPVPISPSEEKPVAVEPLMPVESLHVVIDRLESANQRVNVTLYNYSWPRTPAYDIAVRDAETSLVSAVGNLQTAVKNGGLRQEPWLAEWSAGAVESAVDTLLRLQTEMEGQFRNRRQSPSPHQGMGKAEAEETPTPTPTPTPVLAKSEEIQQAIAVPAGLSRGFEDIVQAVLNEYNTAEQMARDGMGQSDFKIGYAMAGTGMARAELYGWFLESLAQMPEFQYIWPDLIYEVKAVPNRLKQTRQNNRGYDDIVASLLRQEWRQFVELLGNTPTPTDLRG